MLAALLVGISHTCSIAARNQGSAAAQGGRCSTWWRIRSTSRCPTLSSILIYDRDRFDLLLEDLRDAVVPAAYVEYWVDMIGGGAVRQRGEGSHRVYAVIGPITRRRDSRPEPNRGDP